MRTSDIHVEPFEHELRIRYRIDGLLQEVPVPAQIKRFQPAIVSRIKILSNLNIAEKRVPQDGRIKIRVKSNDVDIRVSVIPMLHGEAVVMRLLRQGTGVVGLANLNMNERERRLFEHVLDMPHGIALVHGADRLGQDDHALQRAQPDQRFGPQDHHHRGPGWSISSRGSTRSRCRRRRG